MKKGILLFLLFWMGIQGVQASHVFGGEITWKAVRDNNAQNFQRDGYGFIFIMTVYRDCSGIPMNGLTPTISVQGNPVDKFGSVVNSINLNPAPGRLGAGYEITPICGGTTSIVRCGASNPLGGGGGAASRGAIAGVQFWSDTIWLTGVPPSASGWFFQSAAGAIPCCRNANDNTSCSGDMILRARMLPYFQRNALGQFVGTPVQRLGDSSPEFVENPHSTAIQNSGNSDTSILVIGANDPELDLLKYSIDNPFSALNTPCSYDRGFTINNPLPNIVLPYGLPNYPIDTNSGIMRIIPNTQGNFLICIRVAAFKNGQKVAENFRDFQYVVIANSPGLGYISTQSAPKIYAREMVINHPINSGETLKKYFGDELFLEVKASDYAPFTDSVSFKFNSNSFFGSYRMGVDTFRVDSGCFAPPCATIKSILPVLTNVIPVISLNGMNTGYGVKGRNTVGYQIRWKTSCGQSTPSNSGIQGQALTQNYALNFVAQDNQCPFNGKNIFALNLQLNDVELSAPRISSISFIPSKVNVVIDSVIDLARQEPFDTSLQQSVFRRVNRLHGIQIYRDSCGAGMFPYKTLWKPVGLTDSAQLQWMQQITWIDSNLSRDTCLYRYVVKSIYGCDSLFSSSSDTAQLLVLNARDIPLEKQGWKLYPNPATTKVNISQNSWSSTEVTVFNLQGKVVFKKDFGLIREGEFSVEGWPAGTYLAEIWNKKNGQKLLTSRIKFTVQ